MPARLRPITVVLGLLLLSPVAELEAATRLAFSKHPIISSDIYFPESVFAADLDNDNDLDVLSTSLGLPNKIIWFANTDGAGTFGSQYVIDAPWEYAPSVINADLDNDNDLDRLSIGYADGTIVWYENVDGTLGPSQIISHVTAGCWSLFAVDLDNDSDLDVLAASINDGMIVWYENTDGLGSFVSRQVINTATDGSWSVFVMDLDNDGDMDVLSAGYADGTIAWHENTDGQGKFSQQKVIHSAGDGADTVFSVDLDNDGDLDLLSASTSSDSDQGTIAWQENTDGLGTLGPRQVISDNLLGACSVFAADLDNDGDMDVLSSSLLDNKITWYENLYSRPVADAGTDLSVMEGDRVRLNGSGSSDGHGAVSWAWTQTDGIGVTLLSYRTDKPSFTAPQVDALGAKLTFKLTVTNTQGITASDTVNVTVSNKAKAPVANAGNDRTVSGSTGVSLDGSASTPGEGSITGWAWIQTAGIPVTLSDADKATAGFDAPQADAADETLVFTLTVTNSLGLTSSDEVTITVQGSPESGDTGEPGEDPDGSTDTGDSSGSVEVGDTDVSSSGGGGGCAVSSAEGLDSIGLEWLLLLVAAALVRLRRSRRIHKA